MDSDTPSSSVLDESSIDSGTHGETEMGPGQAPESGQRSTEEGHHDEARGEHDTGGREHNPQAHRVAQPPRAFHNHK